MSPPSRGAHSILSLLGNSTTKTHVCSTCRRTLVRRGYASTATAQVADVSPTTQNDSDNAAAATFPQPSYTIKAGIVLSRPPIVTADLHPFETAYYLYQRRLNERLVLPFTQYFYYKRGTPAYENWRNKRRERDGAAARDIGKYNAYGKDAWNDEVLVGDQSGDQTRLVEQLIDEEGRASEFVGTSGDLKKAGLKRTTEADAKNDQRSLERRLGRTLYLLVKGKDKKDELGNWSWSFPSGDLSGKEGLKEAAKRVLDQSCGVNMNTWFVGNHPVGHFVSLGSKHAVQKDDSKNTEKTFFMKARIMAGQADVKANASELEDYKWLSKDEIEQVVHPNYWMRVKNMLVER